jgi:hypothetical protein
VLIDGKPVAADEAAAAGKTRAKVRSAVRVRDGRHRWLVRSSDRFGNSRDSGTRTVIVDGTAPRVRLRVERRKAARGIRLRLRLNEAARVSATVRLGRGKSGATRSKSFKKGRRTLTIRLSKRLAARSAGKRVRGTLRLTDAVGNVTRKRFTARLR